MLDTRLLSVVQEAAARTVRLPLRERAGKVTAEVTVLVLGTMVVVVVVPDQLGLQPLQGFRGRVEPVQRTRLPEPQCSMEAEGQVTEQSLRQAAAAEAAGTVVSVARPVIAA